MQKISPVLFPYTEKSFKNVTYDVSDHVFSSVQLRTDLVNHKVSSGVTRGLSQGVGH